MTFKLYINIIIIIIIYDSKNGQFFWIFFPFSFYYYSLILFQMMFIVIFLLLFLSDHFFFIVFPLYNTSKHKNYSNAIFIHIFTTIFFLSFSFFFLPYHNMVWLSSVIFISTMNDGVD